MLKYIIAAALLVTATPTAAGAADLMISSGRQDMLHEAAKTICRNVMESEGRAGPAFDRETAHLRLNRDETVYMLSLCVLYAQGRIDQMKAR